MRGVVCLLVVLAAAGCARKVLPAARVAPPAIDVAPAIDQAPADAFFDAGCYRCLKQAFAIYERALEASPTNPRARDGAFVTAVLLALREKELGLEATGWLDRAASLAHPEERIYLDVVSSLAWTSAGAASDFEPARPQVGAREAWRAFLDAAPDADPPPGSPKARHAVLDQYLFLTLACTDASQRFSSEIERRVDIRRPAIRYRLGLCGVTRRPHLEAVLEADPRFVEASFFIGRYEMSSGVSPMGVASRPSRAWLTTAVPPLLAAHEAFPEAPVVSTIFAGLMRSRSDLVRALALYDDALAVRPSQRDALLGRTITLTYLARRDEAIDTATRMIDLGTWHLGQAYYWRALNRYHTSHLDLGAADVTVARRLLVNDDLMTLSGMIAYDQNRPKDARTDFESAVRLNTEKCAAHWYLGILDLDEQAWPAAVPRFSTAGKCFLRAVDSLRTEAAQLPPDLPDDARQLQMAGYEEGISTNVRQAGRSFLNAALSSVRMGDRTGALAYARSASAYEDVKERADSIVRSLEQ